MIFIEESIGCLMDTKLYLSGLNPAEYQQSISLLSNSTIGQHTRHFIEFYQCLLTQVKTGIINYDLRVRDKQIEVNPTFALGIVDEIINELSKLNINQTLILQTDFDQYAKVNTNLAREILYNLEHCIHHLAIIKIGLKIIKPGFQLPENFGVAASTVKFKNQQIRV